MRVGTAYRTTTMGQEPFILHGGSSNKHLLHGGDVLRGGGAHDVHGSQIIREGAQMRAKAVADFAKVLDDLVSLPPSFQAHGLPAHCIHFNEIQFLFYTCVRCRADPRERSSASIAHVFV